MQNEEISKMTIKKKVKSLRKELKLTQEAFGNKVFLT